MGFSCRFGRTRSPSGRASAGVATGRSSMDIDGSSRGGAAVPMLVETALGPCSTSICHGCVKENACACGVVVLRRYTVAVAVP
eukprot:3199387-Pyramimonas_sp.AAC.1